MKSRRESWNRRRGLPESDIELILAQLREPCHRLVENPFNAV